MTHPAPVTLEVFDARGRRVTREAFGMLGGGAHRLVWDGRESGGMDAGAGVYWVKVSLGSRALAQQVVRLR